MPVLRFLLASPPTSSQPFVTSCNYFNAPLKFRSSTSSRSSHLINTISRRPALHLLLSFTAVKNALACQRINSTAKEIFPNIIFFCPITRYKFFSAPPGKLFWRPTSSTQALFPHGTAVSSDLALNFQVCFPLRSVLTVYSFIPAVYRVFAPAINRCIACIRLSLEAAYLNTKAFPATALYSFRNWSHASKIS